MPQLNIPHASVLGHVSQRILVERRLQAPPSQKCLVWGLAFLSDGTVVSVDSAGKVQFWDSVMGTLLSKHPISKAAVLSVAVAEVGESCRMWAVLQILVKRTGRSVFVPSEY